MGECYHDTSSRARDIEDELMDMFEVRRGVVDEGEQGEDVNWWQERMPLTERQQMLLLCNV